MLYGIVTGKDPGMGDYTNRAAFDASDESAAICPPEDV